LAFMRFPYLVMAVAFGGALACATGEAVDSRKQTLFDAGPITPPIDQGGGAAGMEPLGSGGSQSGGMPVGPGGTPAAGGSGTGGKASGGMGSGGKASGGMAGPGGSGGKGGTGGTAGIGMGGKASGGMASGGANPGDAGNCPAGQKFCGGLCTPPAPKVGCAASGCTPCTLTAPMNGYITCTNNQCAFDCLSGYTKNGAACEGSGAGGNVGTCNLNSCPECNIVSGPKCCTAAGKCGCPAIPWVTPTCASPI
jgi:hypothetical protein